MIIKNEKKYRNYEKTDVAIKEALVKLCMQKKSIKKVTVKELCEEANISKSTFYLHYHDIDYIFESVGNKFQLTFKKQHYTLLILYNTAKSYKKTVNYFLIIKRKSKIN